MANFRLHVLGVPHTQTTREFGGCAFASKVHKFLEMMSGRGHEIIHYGHENRDWDYPDVEHVTVIDDHTVAQAYGTEYTEERRWKELGFAHYFNTQDLVHQTFHANAIKEIAQRKKPRDILLCFWGWGHKPIADAHTDMIVIEPGVGYPATFARWVVYESHSVMNSLADPSTVSNCQQDFYRVVIPNYFRDEDFTYSEDKEDYILYLGRIYSGKGVDIAIEATEAAGKRLVIAGQGSLADMGYKTIPDHVTVVGYADAEMRRRLLSKASALFIASKYAEPFAGVQVEAWLSGTPVISPDYAAFAELNRHNFTGYRCRTFRDFVEACKNVEYLNPIQCRKHGEQFLFDAVAPQYERYFEDVSNVYGGKGWYELG